MIKKRWIALYFLALLLPYFVLAAAAGFGLFKDRKDPSPPESKEKTVCLYHAADNTFEELPLKDYLWGVVAGEMPASYPDEALKAQIVASYSYLLHRQKTLADHPGQNFGHDGDICDDPSHCKACLLPEEAAARYGSEWIDAHSEVLARAVESVLGEALLYEGQAANTVFHSVSGGYTEDAEDVWGAKVPYLRSVDSHWDERAEDFSSTLAIPIADFRNILGQTDCSLGATSLTQGGSVATQTIGGKSFTGRELRSLFGLRSTRFILEITEKEAVFSVCGYGHQVGMSQYGASILAEEGYSYEEILLYYYSGTKLEKDYYPIF